MSISNDRESRKRYPGRPLLSEGRKKVRVSMTMTKSTLDKINAARGKFSRSQFIEGIIHPNINENESGVIDDQVKKKNGVVYTPSALASYVAKKVISYYLESLGFKQQYFTKKDLDTVFGNLSVLDPACGYGELLIAMWGALLEKYSDISRAPDNIDPGEILYGVDIDNNALVTAQNRLSKATSSSTNKKFNLLQANALCPFDYKSCYSGWGFINRIFNATDGFDIIIANPPWGADIQSYKDSISVKDFSLYRGQYDTSDLFFELSISLIKPGGFIAFIIPDSLFSHERKALRKILLDKTEIKYIGRFGEKIFDSINRACAVIICKKQESCATSFVDCMRLTPKLRKGILRGELSFDDAENLLKHTVNQSRFYSNPDFLFDIDIKESEEKIVRSLYGNKYTFKDFITSSRGVELSKNGMVCKCHHCKKWGPYPRSDRPTCSSCGERLILSSCEQRSIISQNEIPGYKPLLVGESIKRYRLGSRHWIIPELSGINYKDPTTYEGEKIVIRKTGVGISATIDYQGSYTNQVVYILKQKEKPEIEQMPLEFFLALINSRAMYYLLVKRHGETEWRSHPYLTQKQILDFPVPNIDYSADSNITTIIYIKNLVTPFLEKNQELPPNIDARIERMVASFFSLTKEDYCHIYNTIDQVEELLPIKAMKNVQLADIFN